VREKQSHYSTCLTSREGIHLGQGRGGLYSYDWLENLFGCDVHSTDEVLPDLQGVAVGDTIRLVREGHPADLFFEVAFVHPNRALVLKAPGEPEAVMEAARAADGWLIHG
jgi:hypothetical protein